MIVLPKILFTQPKLWHFLDWGAPHLYASALALNCRQPAAGVPIFASDIVLSRLFGTLPDELDIIV